MKKRKERELLFYLIQDRAQRAVLLLKEDSRFDFSPSQIQKPMVPCTKLNEKRD